MPQAPIRNISMHVDARCWVTQAVQGTNRGEASEPDSKTVHRRACAGLGGAGSLRGSGSVLSGVRCRLGAESLAWRLPTLHAGRQKPILAYEYTPYTWRLP